MTIDLQKARDDAERYYETQEYREKVLELFAIIGTQYETLQNLHIALDLEGVLTNTPFNGKTGISCYKRLRRPFAQELIDFLDIFADKVTIWTAASGGLPEDITESSGIVLPKGVELVDRDKYILRIATEYPEIAKLLASYQTDSNKFPEGMPEGLKSMIISVAVKIAQVYDVDYLLDDGAIRHRAICRIMGLHEDAEKLIRVPPFILKDEKAVAEHHKDDTLIRVIDKFLSSI